MKRPTCPLRSTLAQRSLPNRICDTLDNLGSACTAQVLGELLDTPEKVVAMVLRLNPTVFASHRSRGFTFWQLKTRARATTRRAPRSLVGWDVIAAGLALGAAWGALCVWVFG